MPASPARTPAPDDDRRATPGLRLVVRSDPTVDARRAESRRALAELLALLGYPDEWAEALERRAFARGIVWTRVPSRVRAAQGHGSV